MPGFIQYRKDRTGRTGGRLVTFVANNCTSSVVVSEVGSLETQVISVTLANSKEIKIANVYHRTAEPTNIHELNKLIDLVGHSGLILGDFNAHSPLWDEGAKHSDCFGRMVEDWVESRGLIILNDGSPTRHCPIRGGWTGLDLAIATNDLAHDCQWQVHDDSMGSDHYPCITHLGTPPLCDHHVNPRERGNFSKADWSLFSTECNKIDPSEIISDDIETFCLNLTSAIYKAARASIPLTQPKHGSRAVPWWNEEIAKARRIRKKALNRLQRDKSAVGQVREARKKVKDLIDQARADSWQKFCGSLNHKTNSKQVWQKIHAIRGKRKSACNPKITGATSIPEKASILATHFASVSSSNNFSEEFTKSEKPPPRPKQPPGEQHAYNQCFSVEEFRTAIHHKKGTSPGEDMVSYEMLKRLPDSVAKVVAQLYSQSDMG
ncbi:uncharacterized protein [Haliotis asinina]|uniref:uncharacterized protein n=1 Tax=Haliotis asinina TaxID=109174 RepID=UPI003531B1FC